MLSKGKAVYISEALSFFRLHPDQNSNKMDQKSGSEWLDIIIASREDGFLQSNKLYKTALLTFRNRVNGLEYYNEDIKRIDDILGKLN